jgi:UDP:flavonoid glycosyltransferase YjiC (YdhE family)
MRILVTTRGSSGHLLPLTPIAHACAAAGHEVMVAAQRRHGANVARTGLALTPVGEPADDDWMPLFDRFAELDLDAADAVMIGRFFGGLDTRAALPGLLEAVEAWRPDLIVRESWEFASTIAAELHGIPLARVGLGVASLEERTIALAAPAVDLARREAGLPSDPAGDMLRAAPYLTMTPAVFEGPAAPPAPLVRRFRADVPAGRPAEPDPWPGDGRPLVYLTFGTVTAEAHLPFYPALYRAAVEALAGLPIRILVTIGDDRDPAGLGPHPPNVRVERWVPQDAVAPRAAAVVCHGGYGTTLGALAHGAPVVVVPLFSGDQWENAAAVARVGAGIALDGERRSRRSLDLPGDRTIDALGPAVERVLDDPAYRRAAGRVAAAVRALPTACDTVPVLERIAGNIES